VAPLTAKLSLCTADLGHDPDDLQGECLSRAVDTSFGHEVLMTTRLENEQKELADFIRAGSARGHQCFGSYFDERGGSCALGAVYEGVYHLPRDHGKLVPDHLERLFRCLDEVTKACPQGCQKRLPLASMIVHLNDDHRLTREQIAEWLTQESNA
jgi:hypothetical protein